MAWRAFGWKAVAAAFLLALSSVATARPLTIDDVLAMSRIDQVAASPDGAWVAAVVQRPASPGEVYGRTAYETDPSRNDLWLISRAGGGRRNLTGGAPDAAGFWCASWSPDGRRLAMLSTRPEGNEPRGGDNVRLYIWDSDTNGLSRLSNAAVMTQTRHGSPMHGLDLRGADGAVRRCGGEENAPFFWIDDRRVIAVMLPDGEISGLIDEYSLPLRHAGQTLAALRAGASPTVSAVGSGGGRVADTASSRRALVRTIDVETGAAATIAEVPVYPFRGELSLSLAPDGRRLAVLATIGAIDPSSGRRIPHHDDTWSVEKRLGFAPLAPGAGIGWAAPPPEGRYPLELLAWSPDSRRVAFRARASAEESSTPVFIASAANRSIRRASPAGIGIGTAQAGSDSPHETPVHWVDGSRLIARVDRDGGTGWWLLGDGREAIELTRGAAAVPAAWRRASGGGFYGVAGGRLLSLNVERRALQPVAGVTLPPDAAIAWPLEPAAPTQQIVTSSAGGGFHLVSLKEGASHAVVLPPGAELMAADSRSILWRWATRSGLVLRETGPGGSTRELLALSGHLAEIDWGETRLIDYQGLDGQALQAQILLPPGYRVGRRYPVISWVYPGYQVRAVNDYFLDPHMAGFYNLHLYAARGYVVLVPSMPLKRGSRRNETFSHIPNGVLPAVDRLVALGIADPERIGVMGQSFGGYAVYSLVTQTRRFRAAVAMAGISDLTSLHGEFDRMARGYPAIEHEKSDNWSIIESGAWSMGLPPAEDRELYERNSPINLVDRVETPLLMIHGEFDKRGQLPQAESFFYALYRAGRAARLLRYWGESHSLAQSPANVRSIHEETLRWFDRYLRDQPPRAAGSSAPVAEEGRRARP